MKELSYLFVCSENIDRSPIAEKIFLKILNERKIKGIVSSAGLNVEIADRGIKTQLTQALVDNYQVIIAMEMPLKKRIESMYNTNPGKVYSLDIRDREFKRNDKDLEDTLETQLNMWLDWYLKNNF